jgi:hypothetical protein
MAPRDHNHAVCAKLLRATPELLLPAPVLVELDYFLSQLTGSGRAFDGCYAGSRTESSQSWTWLRRTTHGYGISARSMGTRHLASSTRQWSRSPSGSVRPGSRRSTAAISPPSSPGTSRRSSCFRRARVRLDELGQATSGDATAPRPEVAAWRITGPRQAGRNWRCGGRFNRSVVACAARIRHHLGLTVE